MVSTQNLSIRVSFNQWNIHVRLKVHLHIIRRDYSFMGLEHLSFLFNINLFSFSASLSLEADDSLQVVSSVARSVNAACSAVCERRNAMI